MHIGSRRCGRIGNSGCWKLGRGHFGRLSPRAGAWAGGWVGANSFVWCFWGLWGNQSQIGFPLLAKTLQFVESAVEGALQAAFLAVEQGQRAFALGGCVAHAAGVIQIEILLHSHETLQLAGVETGFLMVETSEAPGRHG